MADVFISYAKSTREAAAGIASALVADGYGVWWDEELPPHRAYADVIEEQIGAAKAVIVIWSREAATSHWVAAEADLARRQAKLVQTTIAPASKPPLPFDRIQVADLSHWRGEAGHADWEKVRAAVSELVRGTPALRSEPARRPATTAVRTAALVAGLALVVAVAWLLGARWLQPVAPSPTSSAGKQADAPRQPIAAAGPGKWFDGALIHTALLVDAQGQPVCNGALIGRQRAISVAECRAEAIIHFRNDGTRAPVRATRREHGAVAVFGFEEADPDVWPSGLAAASPGPDAAVRAFVVTEMGRNHVVSPPCRLTASPVAGQRATDCMNPGGLPGTPLYDDLGTLVALIRAPGAVLTVEQMEADLAWLGVAARTP